MEPTVEVANSYSGKETRGGVTFVSGGVVDREGLTPLWTRMHLACAKLHLVGPIPLLPAGA